MKKFKQFFCWHNYGKVVMVLLILSLSLQSHAQIAIGGLRPVFGGTVNPTIMVSVDYSFEQLLYEAILNINYDILRPNKTINVTGNLQFNMDNVTVGYTGQVQFVLTGTCSVSVNGKINTGVTFPTTGTYTRNYRNTGAGTEWY